MAYIIVYIICVLLAIGGWSVFLREPNPTGLIITVIASFIAILPVIFIIYIQIKKKKEEEQRRLEEEKQEAIKQKQKAEQVLYNKRLQYVKETSEMYKNLLNLNANQNFECDISALYKYNKYSLSKTAFDKEDLEDYLNQVLQEDKEKFIDLSSKVQKNLLKWNNYLKKYNQLKINSKESSIKGVSVQTYNLLENKIFEEQKLKKPITEIAIYLCITYTTPAGMKTYKKDNVYYLNNRSFKKIYAEINEKEQKLKLELEEQRRLEEEKRLKEKRLREVDRLEKQLNEKEIMLEQKEQEFKKATEGHIYSTSTNIKETEENINNNDTPYQKLKKLRTLYENNKISREEYEKRRKALL